MSQIAVKFKKDMRAAKKIRIPWWVLLCEVIGSAFIAALFAHFGRLYLALPVLVTIGMLGFTIAVKWILRRYVWFWVTMMIIAALHVPLILSIPWTTKWVPAFAIAAIGSADACVILAILSAVQNFMDTNNS